jgi:hypothetical protein
LIFSSVEIIGFYNVLGGFAPATAAAPLAISVENRFITDSGNDVRSGIFLEPIFSLFYDQDAENDQDQSDEQTNNTNKSFYDGNRIRKKYPDCINTDNGEKNPDKQRSNSCLIHTLTSIIFF